jgi:tetratricopeptide (TPR) repeat protein
MATIPAWHSAVSSISNRSCHLVCLLVIFLGSIISCSMLHRDAQTLMDAEEYEEAAKIYSQILDEDPKDIKAIIGLKKARINWIDRKLIDVRMLRLAEQAGTATELLKKILEHEREWKFYPEGAVQYTQEEEVRLAGKFISAQVEAWQGSGFILKGRAFLHAYRQIFETNKLVSRYEEINKRLIAAADKQCQGYRSVLDPSYPHSAIFIKRYCDSWDISFDPGFDVAKSRAAALFRQIEITDNIEGVPEALKAGARGYITGEFHETAWYDQESSSSLAVTLTGFFVKDHTRTVEHTVHSYTVQVPYTVMIPQMRTIPHTTYSQSCNAYGCVSIPQTTYTYETYMVPITRYRDDPRQFQYDRWRHHQLLVFHAELNSTVGDTNISAVHTKKNDDTDTEHPHSVPEIGLHPDLLTLPDPLKWVEKQIDAATHQWGRELYKLWIGRYCSVPESAISDLALTEYVLRCLRGNPDPLPAFVDSWHMERFGAGRNVVEQWLDRTDSAPVPPPETPKVLTKILN